MVVGDISGKLSPNRTHAILPTLNLTPSIPYVLSKHLELNDEGTAVSVDKDGYGSSQ